MGSEYLKVAESMGSEYLKMEYLKWEKNTCFFQVL